MTDDEGVAPRWQDLPYDVRAKLEAMGITEVLFKCRVNDPSFEEALRHFEAHNRAEEVAMPPQVRKAHRNARRREMKRDIENDVFLTDRERDMNRE